MSANHNDETSGVKYLNPKSLDDLTNEVDFADYKGKSLKTLKKTYPAHSIGTEQNLIELHKIAHKTTGFSIIYNMLFSIDKNP